MIDLLMGVLNGFKWFLKRFSWILVIRENHPNLFKSIFSDTKNDPKISEKMNIILKSTQINPKLFFVSAS